MLGFPDLKTVSAVSVLLTGMAYCTFAGAVDAPPPAAGVPVPAGIEAAKLPVGTLFRKAAGIPLYVYDTDTTPGKSSCNDKCAVAWPPLTAAADAQPVGPWTIITRDDGSKQWALNGHPLYSYAKDKLPGLATGEGVQDLWHLAIDPAPRPRQVIYRGTTLGRVAADLKGHTLYRLDSDTADGKGCIDACLSHWTPLKAPGAAVAIGDWSAIERADDGSPQWAYQGKPLYQHVNDERPGDTKGEGVDGHWHAVVMQPMPAPPAWVSIQPSDYGPIFANSQGKTLYTLALDLALFEKLSCDDACFRAHFEPVLADEKLPAPQSGSNWGVIANADNKMQWAYRGLPIYTFVNDHRPGEISGTGFGLATTGGTWTPIQASSSLLPML